MAGQMVHPTVGMQGMAQQGFPPEGTPLSQAPRYAVQPGAIGAPQFQGGPAPVNGFNPQSWQQYVQPGQMQPQLQQPQYQQPQMQQHPTVPYQPWEQPGYQQPQQRPQQMPQLAPQGQEILNGPGVPLELRGRTFGQAMQLYTQLADDYIRRGRQQPQQQQPQGQPQQQMPAYQQPQAQQSWQQGQQPQQQRPAVGFFQNPDQSIREVVRQELAPIQEFTQQQAAERAQAAVFPQIPDLPQIQGHLQNILRDADPKLLSQPEFLMSAADLARGRAMREQMGQQQPQMQQQYQAPQGQQYYGQNGNGRFMPAGQQHFPQPVGSFFTEGPTPPMWGQRSGGDMSDFGPDAIGMMQATGMTPEQYRAWSQGSQRQQQGWRR